ncbi:Uma2 family endonuclease [Dictyobacter alpinus]|uniref:Uma2 family endonuclease n=1 Tax=Dictyobacter alpinus TaxID=2014873 RepID=UPI0013868DA2|nr:Uma2 family endonuclease [Dictyobacter alpinus]
MAINPQHENGSSSLHGIPVTEEGFEQLISLEGPYRYEFIAGVMYDMTGSSPEHADISSNLEYLLKEQLGRSGPCRVYREQYVFIPGQPSVVPDVVVTCDVGDRDKEKRMRPFKIRSPLIAIEVLSPSTEAYDRVEKFARYQHSPTLEVYILVSQDEKHVEMYRRATGWVQERFQEDQMIELDQLDLELPLSSIYEGVL